MAAGPKLKLAFDLSRQTTVPGSRLEFFQPRGREAEPMPFGATPRPAGATEFFHDVLEQLSGLVFATRGFQGEREEVARLFAGIAGLHRLHLRLRLTMLARGKQRPAPHDSDVEFEHLVILRVDPSKHFECLPRLAGFDSDARHRGERVRIVLEDT